MQINQFLPNLSYGDAISNHAIWIRDRLRSMRFVSDIYVRFIDPRVEHDCRVFSPVALHGSDAVIYHHSIGSEITPHVLEFSGPKSLIYHNITPAEFVQPYRPQHAGILRRGREDLHQLAHSFPISYGDSAYNVEELAACGFKNPRVLPIAVDPAKWNFSPDPSLMAALQDGRTNILFVGRIAPNKKQADLVAAFREYIKIDPQARLILAGKPELEDPYTTYLAEVIRALGLQESVVLPGSITEAELAAYYRTAHLFWSMSEHEGFCVPLIEAMWFDVPVLAYRSTAIPETLGRAGLMFTSKDNFQELAALAHQVIADVDLRRKMISAQREQRKTFLPHRLIALIVEIAERLGGFEPEVNQCLPNLVLGDAISNQALVMRDILRAAGYRSKILVRYRDYELAGECDVFSPGAVQSSRAIIYHHSIGNELIPHVMKYPGPKALIYHNITPAEFYEPFAPEFAGMLRRGRDGLCELAPEFPHCFGVSRYNCAELDACGFAEPGVLPICVDPQKIDVTPDRDVLERLQDGRVNLLFVGRITPNKKQDDLVRAFVSYRRLDPDARLVLVGRRELDDPYALRLEELIASEGLQDAVICAGYVSNAQLAAYYRTARVFWSMSEHEGFCVPLVEAMWFDIPVYAYASSAVSETVANPEALFSDKRDFATIAERVYELAHDGAARENLLRPQRLRREAYLPEQVQPIILRLAERLSRDSIPPRPRRDTSNKGIEARYACSRDCPVPMVSEFTAPVWTPVS